ncbi:hypothetical protein BKA80DRAFT_48080 [Phyllosticta citrichinensis]
MPNVTRKLRETNTMEAVLSVLELCILLTVSSSVSVIGLIQATLDHGANGLCPLKVMEFLPDHINTHHRPGSI